MLILYKYLSIDDPKCWEYRRQFIAKREIYFNDPSNFNDPLDCNVSGWEAAKDYVHNCRIFCMSTQDRDDNLMFAHYADEHKGFRLKFNVDNDQKIGNSSVLALGREVRYLEKIPEFTPVNAVEYYFNKATSWQYESEYRILLARNDKATYLNNELVEVALGYRFNMDFVPVIKKWVTEGKHADVKFVKAVPSSKSLSFEYEEINA